VSAARATSSDVIDGLPPVVDGVVGLVLLERLVGCRELFAGGFDVLVGALARLLAFALLDAGLVGGLLADVALEAFVGLGSPLLPLLEGASEAGPRVDVGIVNARVPERAGDAFPVFDDVAPVAADLESRYALFHLVGAHVRPRVL